jgi:GTPase SAR1 family protein
MGENTKLKLFVSYSHKDKDFFAQFKTHIAPFRDIIEVWSDHEIRLGENLQNKIDFHLNDADIICLLISANYFDSSSCMSEKEKAFKLKQQKGVQISPVLLSPCNWEKYGDIYELLASPTDAKPVSKFNDRDEAWVDVCKKLDTIIENELKIRKLEITEVFHDFLQDTEMLTKAHSKKENVFLDDIFVCTELDKYDYLKENKETISSSTLLQNLLEYGKIIIAGDDQSGKTTLCKKIFSDLRNCNFVPVYLSDENTNFSGLIKNHISKSLREQYYDIDLEVIDKERIVPIIDNFHHANNKEKHIEYLSKYSYCVIIVDDIFGLNIKDETLISSFTTFRIKELKPSLRDELVKKWECLTDSNIEYNYQKIDQKTELINTTLGKNLGKGIMPAYPFFILSIILTYETFMPLDQEITSQGYCYQAFIYHYLRRHGVRNDEIDSYINFLTQLASHIYKESEEELKPDNFSIFMESYLETYNLPIEQDILLDNLREIIIRDSFGNYSFRYPYFYYFFVAKSLSEHIEASEVIEDIKYLLNNLHVDENAYIAVFLTHHSKNTNIFNEIEIIASSLFDSYEPATLTKNEMTFFDEQAHIIVKAVLPPGNMTPEKERANRLNYEDKFEQSHGDIPENEDYDDEDHLEVDIRRAIKTVEVMGCIIRNRAGSLKKVELESLFMDGMNVHLRILSALFETIKSEDERDEIVNFIIETLNRLEEGKDPNKKLSEEEKREYAEKIFWNLNFFTVYGLIYKIVNSLGSDKINPIINAVCDKTNTPASFLIKHGIFMEYSKNLQVMDLVHEIEKDVFSEIAEKAARLMVVNYCSRHVVNFKDKQRINDLLLKGSSQKILPNQKSSHE